MATPGMPAVNLFTSHDAHCERRQRGPLPPMWRCWCDVRAAAATGAGSWAVGAVAPGCPAHDPDDTLRDYDA